MGKRSKNNKQTMAASNFKLSISQSTVMGKAAPTKAGVVFVVDRSGSMTFNGELDAALNGAKAVTDQVVTENDVVTFWSFSNDLKLHFKAKPSSPTLGWPNLTPSSWVSASRPLPRPSCATCVL